MSGSSYPSPVSSPSRTDTPPAPSVSAVASASNRHDTIDTQRSLHQASAALEAAYNRIRQVRRNLLELTEILPSSQLRMSGFNDIGPGHEVITLTQTLAEEPEPTNERNNVSPPSIHSLMGRLMRYERMLGLDTTRDGDPSSPDLPQQASASQSTTNRSPFLLHPNSIPNTASRRRNPVPDDASTSLGRRVAAREAAGFTPSWNVSRNSLADREVEGPRFPMRQRRTTDTRRLEPLVEHRREDATTPAYEPARRFTQVRDTTASVPGLHPEPRRGPGEPRISQSTSSGSTHSERLSLLSNLSVQNLATPGSGNISRPLLFDEPSSYIPAANFMSPPEPRDQAQTPVEEERNYVIRRRMNADGEEHIHPISLDWSDEEASWILPRVYQDDTTYDESQTMSLLLRLSARYHPRRDTIQPTQTPAGRRRRRGWARLDADGNEIPSDEEEEIERIRTENRVRAQNFPRPLITAPTQGIEVRPRLHTLHPPTSNTRTGMSPDEDPSYDADAPPRVHLGPHERNVMGPTVDSHRQISLSHPHRALSKPIDPHTSTSLPFCADPLPMPLEEMLPPRKPATNSHSRVIRVLDHAIFAGR